MRRRENKYIGHSNSQREGLFRSFCFRERERKWMLHCTEICYNRKCLLLCKRLYSSHQSRLSHDVTILLAMLFPLHPTQSQSNLPNPSMQIISNQTITFIIHGLKMHFELQTEIHLSKCSFRNIYV